MKKSLMAVMSAMLIVISCGILSCQPRLSRQATEDPMLQMQKFTQFYRYLTGSYIDTIDNSKMIEVAIKEILAELDPHSSYFSPEDMVEVRESFNGSFSGIGIQFNLLRDTLHVVNTVVGGPSEQVGVLANDRIIAVDGESIIGIGQNDVLEKLRGPKGSRVDIEVFRQGTPGTLDFTIIRDDIPIYTIDAAYKPDATTGYIKVNRFAQTTMQEMTDAFREFGEIDALILDLRGNGGGLLPSAIEMSNFFLPAGAVIVSTEGRVEEPFIIRTTHNGLFRKGKVIVLIDEFSASGSEIVAGALQDWDRAVVVGRRSFGKGLVQRQFNLIDGSAVNITIARYLTPTGRTIQRPFEKGQRDRYYEDLIERFEKGYTDSLPRGDSLLYKTLRLGKDVYGGGGIFPDYYVPSDTTDYSPYWSSLIRRGVVHEYLNDYMDSERNSLSAAYPNFETFERNYTVSDRIIRSIVELGEQKGIEEDKEGLARVRPRLELQIKALVAQRLWNTTEFYRIINSEYDEAYSKALEVIRDWDSEATGIATDSI